MNQIIFESYNLYGFHLAFVKRGLEHSQPARTSRVYVDNAQDNYITCRDVYTTCVLSNFTLWWSSWSCKHKIFPMMHWSQEVTTFSPA